jgi:hypothetical protein
MNTKFSALLVLLTVIMDSHAADLDDGISLDTPIDDSIKTNTNINYIKLNAISKAKNKSKIKGGGAGSCGSGNIVIGAGSRVKEIINVSTNKGTTAICGK